MGAARRLASFWCHSESEERGCHSAAASRSSLFPHADGGAYRQRPARTPPLPARDGAKRLLRLSLVRRKAYHDREITVNIARPRGPAERGGGGGGGGGRYDRGPPSRYDDRGPPPRYGGGDRYGGDDRYGGGGDRHGGGRDRYDDRGRCARRAYCLRPPWVRAHARHAPYVTCCVLRAACCVLRAACCVLSDRDGGYDRPRYDDRGPSRDYDDRR